MRTIYLVLFAAAAFAQGTEPKPSPEEYDVHGQAKSIGIGAEYMVHSFSGDGQTFIAEDFLIVEVALYPPKGGQLSLRVSDFALRVNGKKPPIGAVGPQMVVASLTRPEFQSRGPHLEGGAGMGNVGVILGRPVPTNGPRTPRAPDAPDRSGLDKPVRTTASEVAVLSALPEGSYKSPVSGFLYFPWKGKPGSIKNLELLYGDTALKLR